MHGDHMPPHEPTVSAHCATWELGKTVEQGSRGDERLKGEKKIQRGVGVCEDLRVCRECREVPNGAHMGTACRVRGEKALSGEVAVGRALTLDFGLRAQETHLPACFTCGSHNTSGEQRVSMS